MEKDWKKIWLAIKDSSHQFMDSWALFWPNLPHIHMHKETLLRHTRKSCSSSITKLQNFNKNLETDFIVGGQFKAKKGFQYVAWVSRKRLQSRINPNTRRIEEHEPYGLLCFPIWHIMIHVLLIGFLVWFTLIGTFWSDWYKLIDLTLPESKSTMDEN